MNMAPIAALTILISTAVATTAATAGDREPAVITSLREFGAEITDIGDLPRPPKKPSMHCVVATKEGKAVPMCMSLDMELVIPIGPKEGVIFSNSGENLTTKLLDDAKIGLQSPQGLEGTAPAALQASAPGGAEEMMKELKSAHGFSFGEPSAPELYFVADPFCPYCHAAWVDMQKSIKGGALRVKLIPIGELGAESIRAAEMLFEVPDPTDRWMKFEAGQRAALYGNPGENSRAALLDNHNLFVRWDFRQFPFFAYRASNGKIRIVRGQPSSIDTILADMPKRG